jgi:pimeloyl-ACP methyl ester carboxylesterase
MHSVRSDEANPVKAFFYSMILAAQALASANAASSEPAQSSTSVSSSVHYQSVKIDGLSIFYREAGPKDAPVLLLLHGFPSSSRMFDPLIERLADHYHLIAPDYPGFGHSDAPAPSEFAYTFDHIAEVVDHFSQALGLKRYALFVQDYGGPVGMRLAIAHPERLTALIVQNAVSHEDGLGPLWEKRRAFWADRATHQAALEQNFISLDATRLRHLGSSPNVERYNPDLWADEFAFLSRPGQVAIQTDLFYDYRTNVASYPKWQAWLRANHPTTLVIWGQYDPSFQVAEAQAYRRDLPDAEIHVIEAGHFAMDEKPDEVAALVKNFMTGKHIGH